MLTAFVGTQIYKIASHIQVEELFQ